MHILDLMAFISKEGKPLSDPYSWNPHSLRHDAKLCHARQLSLRKARSQATLKGRTLCPLALDEERPLAINQQHESFLFRLPQELRDQVWQYVLVRPRGGKKAHFHVYDDVYNSCTYEFYQGETSLYQLLRRYHPTRMSLLMTCRAIYNEALQFLYNNARFTLVLLPGFARPYYNVKFASCRRLGKLQECQAMFRRMRDVTIIVQPGVQPKTSKYTARIAELLQVLDFGRQARKLVLHFNGHEDMFHYDRDFERRGAILDAFKPLGPPLAAKLESKKVQLELRVWSRDGSYHPKLFDLQEALGSVKIVEWHPLYAWRDNTGDFAYENTVCLRRGAFGRPESMCSHTRPRSVKERRTDDILIALGTVTFFFTLPLSVPIVFACYWVHYRRKGER